MNDIIIKKIFDNQIALSNISSDPDNINFTTKIPTHFRMDPSNGFLEGEMKHIYKTSSESYRIRIKVRNSKFNRCSSSETDALWLCELALIIINRPVTLNDAVTHGNYRILASKGLVVCPIDFAIKLRDRVEYFKLCQLLREEEIVIILNIFPSLLPLSNLPYYPHENYSTVNSRLSSSLENRSKVKRNKQYHIEGDNMDSGYRNLKRIRVY